MAIGPMSPEAHDDLTSTMNALREKTRPTSRQLVRNIQRTTWEESDRVFTGDGVRAGDWGHFIMKAAISALIMLTTVGAGLVYIYFSRPVKTNEIYTNFPAYLTGLIITTMAFSYVIAGKSMLRPYGWFITSLPVLGMMLAVCLPYIIFFR